MPSLKHVKIAPHFIQAPKGDAINVEHTTQPHVLHAIDILMQTYNLEGRDANFVML